MAKSVTRSVEGCQYATLIVPAPLRIQLCNQGRRGSSKVRGKTWCRRVEIDEGWLASLISVLNSVSFFDFQ